MKVFLARQWFLIGLAVVLALGFTCWPTLIVWAKWFPEKLVVASVLFLMSWSLDSHAMWRAISRPAAAALGIAVNFIVVPLLALAVTWTIAHWLPEPLSRGLCLAAALPCTLASAAVWTRRAGGNDAVALVVTLVTNVSCFLVTPLLLWLMTGREVAVADGETLSGPWRLVLSLAVVAVLPMVVGQLLRIPRPLAGWATAHKSPLSIVCLFGILMMVLLGAVNSASELHATNVEATLGIDVWLLLIIAAGVMHTSALIIGFGAARVLGIARADAIAVGFAGSQKTLMIGLHIALTQKVGIGVLPLVVYHVLQLMIDTAAADFLRRRSTLRAATHADEDAAAVT